MSNQVKDKQFRKNKADIKKSRQFIGGKLIRYREDDIQDDFYEMMKKGYLEMAGINLELSEEPIPQKTLQYRFDDINEYEKWLCGV